MRASGNKCIYCGVTVPPGGQGDHVVPAALGKFEGAFLFRAICRGCNSAIGACEEHLTRVAPEAVCLRKLNPPVERDHRGRSYSTGAGGHPPPRLYAQYPTHLAPVLIVDASNDLARYQDAIILISASRDPRVKPHVIPFNAEMTVKSVRAAIERSGIADIAEVRWHAEGDLADRLVAVLRELYPASTEIPEGPAQEPGVHRAPVRWLARITPEYWRAIAKIAFHYHLCTTRFGVRGDEPQYALIRQFIRYGGDRRPFFDGVAPRFSLPYGEVGGGVAVLSERWKHILAVDDSFPAVAAMVALFAGPEHIPTVHSITLAHRFSFVIAEGRPIAHEYLYDETFDRNRAGVVQPFEELELT